MKAEISKMPEPRQVSFEWSHIAIDDQALKIWQVGKPADRLWRHLLVYGKHDDMMIVAKAGTTQDGWQSARSIGKVESVIEPRRSSIRIAELPDSRGLKELRLRSLLMNVPGTMGKYQRCHERHDEYRTQTKLEPPHC
jgi:hypothetical protein